ncbi:ImmA/IrrE family metallo-endopeptidase [uncultured Staphylococcus sp.]|uniref:ImmA/IrrE family metallo-endopeptidase n=1 Tax=uncultured Staphylococcus sp. TaxID=189668 RepID=UPI0025E0055E|nr:ImmA/IrrE family metallo-endopeptidase [uncultured Staphylococcus sp.]
MRKYEELASKNSDIDIIETDMLPEFQSGCYVNGAIYIKESIPLYKKHEVLHEELAHHELTYGNILDQSKYNHRKFENYARRRAFETACPLSKIINAYYEGIESLYELAEYLELTEKFLLNALEYYKQKYGLSVLHNHHLITFEPLKVYQYHKVN